MFKAKSNILNLIIYSFINVFMHFRDGSSKEMERCFFLYNDNNNFFAMLNYFIVNYSDVYIADYQGGRYFDKKKIVLSVFYIMLDVFQLTSEMSTSHANVC